MVEEGTRSRNKDLVKLDFEKAHDRVYCGFLNKVLERKGSSVRRGNKISSCHSLIAFVVLVNGKARD